MQKDFLKEIKKCADIPCKFKIQIFHNHWYRGKYNNRNIVKNHYKDRFLFKAIPRYIASAISARRQSRDKCVNEIHGTWNGDLYNNSGTRILGTVKNSRIIFGKNKS